MTRLLVGQPPAVDDYDHLGWQKRAACLEADPELFFPERGYSSAAAKAICATCPVIAECLAYALATHQQFGTWGGTTERERRKLRRQSAELRKSA